ncbi:DUF3185 family protein [Aliikangiella sp. IMCC44359]|uniref:DUF3185 family protein n=1 Tax=Aliikangiella sp. IMCC44359 TaxID=3459125 RepID=UPI00403A92E6
MATSKIKFKVAAIALIIIGAGTAFWGYQMSESIGSQLSQSVTGSYSDKVMLLLIGGAATFAVGIYLFIKK